MPRCWFTSQQFDIEGAVYRRWSRHTLIEFGIYVPSLDFRPVSRKCALAGRWFLWYSAGVAAAWKDTLLEEFRCLRGWPHSRDRKGTPQPVSSPARMSLDL